MLSFAVSKTLIGWLEQAWFRYILPQASKIMYSTPRKRQTPLDSQQNLTYSSITRRSMRVNEVTIEYCKHNFMSYNSEAILATRLPAMNHPQKGISYTRLSVWTPKNLLKLLKKPLSFSTFLFSHPHQSYHSLFFHLTYWTQKLPSSTHFSQCTALLFLLLPIFL